jgi:hypothetical protein
MRDEVTGDWIKLHDVELHNLYSSPDFNSMVKLREMSWAGNVAFMRVRKSAYRTLVGKTCREDATLET